MLKNIIKRALIGAPIGFALSTFITVIISVIIGDGEFYPVVPAMAVEFGSEINAVVAQMLFSFLYGGAFAGASVIWEADSWSLLRKTVTHLIIVSVCTFPVAYFCHWMGHDIVSIISYFAIFFMIYLSIWISQYIAIKKNLQVMNEKLSAINQ